MESRKVLVTGGAGFIGSHVADAFIARGDRVWIVDDLSSGREANIPKQAEFVRASINDKAAAELFEKVGGFDIVSHHAAQLDVRKSVEDPRHDARINIDGLLNLTEAAVRTKVRRILFVSSGGVIYGEPEQRPTVETAPKEPLSPYGVTKLASEYYLNYYAQVHGLEYASLRYSNVYGPRQNPHGEAGVIAIFCDKLVEGAPITIYGDGLQTRDYIYVGDVVAANMILADLDMPASTNLDQRAFNVGTGVEASVVELAEELMRAAQITVPIRHEPERRGELRHSCLDASRLRATGWEPKQTLREGLRITYDFISNRE